MEPNLDDPAPLKLDRIRLSMYLVYVFSYSNFVFVTRAAEVCSKDLTMTDFVWIGKGSVSLDLANSLVKDFISLNKSGGMCLCSVTLHVH